MTLYFKTLNQKSFEELLILFTPLDIKIDDAFKYEILLDNGLLIKVSNEESQFDDKFTYFLKNKALFGSIMDNYILLQSEDKLFLFDKEEKSILSELRVSDKIRTSKKYIGILNRKEIHIYTIQK